MILYGIYDRASGMYVDRVLVLPADAAAKRIFFEACRDQRSELAKYPTDYELMRLGSFDPVNGVIDSDVQMIARGEKADRYPETVVGQMEQAANGGRIG